jgi:cyanate permease
MVSPAPLERGSAGSTPVEAPVSGYRWTVMALYWGANTTAFLTTFSFLILLPAITQDLGLSVQQVAILASLPWLSMAILSLPLAAFLPRFGARLVLALTLGVGALFAFGQAIAGTFAVMFLARLGLSMIVVARQPAATMLTQQWFRPSEVARVNGVSAGINNLAQAAALGVTPLLVAWLGGWRQALALYAGLLVVLLALWMIGGRERAIVSRGSADPETFRSSLGVFRRFPSLWIVACCQVGAAVGFGAYLSFWPTYAVDVQGLSLAAAGSLLTFWPIGSLVGSFGSDWIAKAVGSRKRVVATVGFILPACCLGLLYSPSEIVSGALLFGIGFCTLITVPLLSSLPFSYPGIRPREMTVALGAFYSISTLGAASGPLIVGAIQGAGGTVQLGLAVAGIATVWLGVAGLLLPEFDRPRLRAATG